MQIAYMLEMVHGDSLADQRTALQRASVPVIEGHDSVYIDRIPKGRLKRRLADNLDARIAMLKAVRLGDVVCVAGLERLGVSEKDIATTLGEITQRGAAVLDAKSGRTYRFDPAVTELYQAIHAAGAALMLERTKPGRASAQAMGLMSGAKPRLDEKTRAAAKVDWHDASMRTPYVTAKYGTTAKTLYNYFGPRFAVAVATAAKRNSK